jgi:hypothetical protein
MMERLPLADYLGQKFDGVELYASLFNSASAFVWIRIRQSMRFFFTRRVLRISLPMTEHCPPDAPFQTHVKTFARHWVSRALAGKRAARGSWRSTIALTGLKTIITISGLNIPPRHRASGS